MAQQRILYISQEINPYLPESPLSRIGRDLPQKMQEKGYEVRTFMPKYGLINERRNQLHEVIRLSGMNVSIDDTDHPLIIKVATLQPSRMQVYFIDNDDYFQHPPVKELETVSSPADNDERMMFFVRGVMETVKKLRWQPALIHLIGWISSLAPLYIRRQYAEDPTFATSKIVYTLREESFEGTLDEHFVDKLKAMGFTEEELSPIIGQPVDFMALNKIAIAYSDAVIISSENVPQELIEYAQQMGKPVHTVIGEEDYTPCADIYSGLIEE